MLNRSVFPVLAISWLTGAPALAAENLHITVGDKLRIRVAQGRTVGTLESLDERMLTLKDLTTSETTAYSLDSVHGVEVSRGRESRGRNAGKGARIGGAIGVAFGVGAATLCDSSEEGCGGAWIPLAGGVAGATGALLGALIGAVISPGEAWRPVKLKGLHPSVTPVPGGAQLHVTFAF